MNAEELRQCMDYLGWTPAELARRLDMSERNARRMYTGERVVRDNVAAWLRRSVQALATAPQLPEGWHPG